MTTVPLLKKISRIIYLPQCVWREALSGRHRQDDYKSRQRWGCDMEAYSPKPLKVIWDNFPFQVLTVNSLWDIQSLGVGREDRHCKAVNSCRAVGTLKLDYTQRHAVFQHPDLLGDPDQCSLHSFVCPGEPLRLALAHYKYNTQKSTLLLVPHGNWKDFCHRWDQEV